MRVLRIEPGTRPASSERPSSWAGCWRVSGIGLVYGGASIGLMGAVADAALGAGGEVIGVIPDKLFEDEVAHEGLSELHVVSSMHERKALMSDLADGFIALPGGYGTIEEVVEAVTWTQLGIHAKPVGLLDVDGYFAHLLAFLDRAVGDGLLRRPAVTCCSATTTVLDSSSGWPRRRVATSPLAGNPPAP